MLKRSIQVLLSEKELDNLSSIIKEHFLSVHIVWRKRIFYSIFFF